MVVVSSTGDGVVVVSSTGGGLVILFFTSGRVVVIFNGGTVVTCGTVGHTGFTPQLELHSWFPKKIYAIRVFKSFRPTFSTYLNLRFRGLPLDRMDLLHLLK